MIFTITSFFLVPPGENGPTYTLLGNADGTGLSGSWGIGGGALCSASLALWQTNPPEAEGLFGIDSSGDELSYATVGNPLTLLPYSVPYPAEPAALQLWVSPDPHSYSLVRVTLTIDGGTVLTEPPPLISPVAKHALAVVTEQLDTLSRGFDMLNAANPFAAGLKTANWGVSNAVNALSPQIGFANSVQQTALSVEDTAVAAGEGNPVAAVLGTVSTIYGLTGVVTGALAADPPDGNYTSVFQPTNNAHTIAGATATDNALIADSINFLDDTLSMLVASERYQGAVLGGDSASATLQTNAFDAAQTASLADSAAMSSDLTAFQTELVSDGYTDQSYGSGSLAAVQSELATAGTSDPFLTNLIANTQSLLGGTAAAQTVASQVLSDIGSETAAPVAGTVFGGIGSAGTDLTAYSNGTLQCFLQGTVIRTVRGEVPVERLVPGDLVVVADGEDLPAIWIGHRRVDAARHPDPRAVWPVRIAAGTFGKGQPYRDLFLSPDHAVFVMDVLVPVKHLIDGVSIARMPMPMPIYYHVELPWHDAIFANGLVAESYLETGDRARFDDADGAVRLFPDFSRPASEPIWEAVGRAPLVVAGPELASVRAFLAARAARPGQRAPAPLRLAV